MPLSEQLFTKPRSKPKIEPDFEALSWFSLKLGCRKWGCNKWGLKGCLSGKYPLGCSIMCWLSWFSGRGFCSCPGFHLGLGAPRIVSLGWHFAVRALGHCLDLLTTTPPPPAQKRDAQHMFLQHRGARAESGRPSWKSAKIGLFRPFSAFFALFRRVRRAPGKSRKLRKKAFFLRYPQICLNPHLSNPHLRHPNKRKSHKIRMNLGV